jgi:methanogenic corrinoid protein MtbC1
MRTPTNIRFYTDDQLKRLLNFGILVRNGYRVSKLDKMSDEEVFDAVTKILNDPESKDRDEIKGLTLSMLEMKEEEFHNIFERQVIRKGFLKTITEMIYTFLQYVGVLWNTNRAMVAQEHFVSNLIRQKIIAATERLSVPSSQAPSIVFFLLEGEDHEIGLLLANFIAKELGWRTYYLGQSVPVINIDKVIEIAEPNVVMTMLVTPKPSKVRNLVESVSKNSVVPFLVSGNEGNLKMLDGSPNVRRVNDPDAFVEFLRGLSESIGHHVPRASSD